MASVVHPARETAPARAQTGGAFMWPSCSGAGAGEPFLARRGAVSPSMTIAATAPSRPFSAHSSLFGRHISITASAGKPSAKSKRADIPMGHAVTHSTRSPKRAVHFRPLAVASITIRNGAADLIGIVGLNCSTIIRHLGVDRRTTLWNIVPVTLATLTGPPFSWSGKALRGCIEPLRAEHLSNKLPGFSPTLLGEFTACSRLKIGGKGDGRSFMWSICWRFLVLPDRIELSTSPLPRT